LRLYPDPKTGYPPKYARDDIPVITAYPNGQTVPSRRGKLGFKPGDLIGCVSVAGRTLLDEITPGQGAASRAPPAAELSDAIKRFLPRMEDVDPADRGRPPAPGEASPDERPRACGSHQ
jgi:hypothetical protein